MLKILSLDPSGTGTTGICLINGSKITFQQYQSPEWKHHYAFIQALTKDYQPNILLYETTNFIRIRGKDMTSLFKLLGVLEVLPVKKVESILVNQVKDLKAKLLKETRQIKDLTYHLGRGNGWFYQAQKISVHQLDAFLVYWLWKEKNA